MRETVLLLAVAAVSYVAFVSLAASQQRHWRAVMGDRGYSRALAASLRLLAAILLAGSYGIALLRDGPSFGTLLWMCMMTVAALATISTLVCISRR